jgi:hypothetical protein
MRKDEIAIFKRLLTHVGENYSRLPSARLTGFLAMVGGQYDGELMVIGRAVNGWNDEYGWLPKDLVSPARVGAVAEQTLGSVTDSNDCPMRWVIRKWGWREKYSTRRSAFWRSIRKTVQGLALADIEGDHWSSCLAWSNLYKIAPAEHGNPSSALGSLQRELCKELLVSEICSLNPRRILFLTGLDWATPFLGGWARLPHETPEGPFVKAIAVTDLRGPGQGRVVVAVHPQGKKESLWVNEVLAAFCK